MVENVSFKLISSNEIEYLRLFLDVLGNSSQSFRYFNTRNLEVINNHLLTVVLLNNDCPIGYGHLDKEGDKVWLGIAVAEGHHGNGYGNQIMSYLMQRAIELGLDEIFLSVDKSNTNAICLYRKFEFIEADNVGEEILIMKRFNKILDLYVSSIAFEGQAIGDIIEICVKESFALEFSSGLPFNSKMIQIYREAKVKRMPHNYFPAPDIPFVLNLASKNSEIRSLSIEHCIQGLNLAKHSNSPFFAAHAGFCIDPKPFELGKKINYDEEFEREDHFDLFLESISLILEHARNIGVKFLIENNVISHFNLTETGKNPLLCCDSNDIISIFAKVKNDYFGLLLDTAHLKVSCNTLDLSLEEEIRLISKFINGIHHSDNDGIKDSNEGLTEDYWFLKFMPLFKEIPQVLEVKNISLKNIKEQFQLLKLYGCQRP